MIQNRNMFTIGLALAGIGAILRHGDRLGISEYIAQFPFKFPDVMLLPKSWVVAGGLLMVLSFIAGRSFQWRRKPRREKFEACSIENIDFRIRAWCKLKDPDIPLLVDYLIFQAIHLGASDLHFDPSQEGLHVKYRLEGMLHPVTKLEKRLGSRVVNRLKVLSNLVIYKDQTPQDGRFDRADNTEMQTIQLQRSGLAKTDFRIAFMPTLHGERIVIRILGTGTKESSLRSLGMSEENLKAIQRLVAQPQGMIILTGPTGSGKTTTIFAALQEILLASSAKRSVSTLEDPIEFDVANINQSQVDEKRGFTFEKGLRAILRQDPDVIMVGEIRDLETARIAIQAGMTGHLLITTVHAGTSAAVFSRMAEMGIPAFSLNSAITAVIAQRLIRNICPNCKTEKSFDSMDLQILGVETIPDGFVLYHGTGCAACDNTGYAGRTAIFEILEMSEPIRQLIADGVGSEEIYQYAKKNGLQTLWESGLAAVRRGDTTLAEIERTIASAMK